MNGLATCLRAVASAKAWGLGLGLAAILITATHASSTDVADAAKRKDAATVKELLRSGADVNAAQGDGMTALHWAATNGDAALTQMLLSAGANIRAVAGYGVESAILPDAP